VSDILQGSKKKVVKEAMQHIENGVQKKAQGTELRISFVLNTCCETPRSYSRL